jgi:hypothetical protein
MRAFHNLVVRTDRLTAAVAIRCLAVAAAIRCLAVEAAIRCLAVEAAAPYCRQISPVVGICLVTMIRIKVRFEHEVRVCLHTLQRPGPLG